MVSRIIPQGVLITIVCFSSYTAAGETKQDAKTSLRFGAVQMQGTILEPVCTISTADRLRQRGFLIDFRPQRE